jgi:hypothetical protein
MDIKAIIMEEIIDKRSNLDKAMYAIQRFINSNASPYMLTTRGGGRSGISPATAYSVKMLVDLLPQLSPEELDQLKQMKFKHPRTGKEFSFTPYVEQIQRLGTVKQGKADMKNISNDAQYSTLIQNIKEKIEDFLKEQESKIDKTINENWKYIHDQYHSMTRDEFAKRYGEMKTTRAFGNQPTKEYYSMNNFQVSYLGVLLRTKAEHLPEFIAKTQKAYREKEYSKVDGLIYKLKVRFPLLTDFQMTKFNRSIDGIEFTLSANSPEGVVSIHTQTIYAGGYNIQKLHLRWLMHVRDVKGVETKIEV